MAKTLKDVAEAAGVSSATASLVLNGRTDGRVSADLASRVEEAADRLNYRPNLVARSLRTQESKTIGIISNDVATTPLAGPAIGTVSVLTFLPMWNSYIWPVMTVHDEQFRPIMIGLQYFYVNFGTAWGQIMAYLTILTIPVVILFLSMQRFFVNSIATTGIKG